MILANAYVVTMDDAGTEHERGWIAFEDGVVIAVGGGIVVSENFGIRAELPLPIAGLLSDEPLPVVLEQSRAVHEAVERQGCTFPAPFQMLSFLALSVIPSLKITDRGLVDVDRFQLVPLKI